MTSFALKIERAGNGYIITAGDKNVDTQKLVVELGIDDIPKYKIAASVGFALLNAIEFNNGSHVLYVEDVGSELINGGEEATEPPSAAEK